MRAQEFITERKKRSKKTRGLGGYFFPGYGFYGGDSGEGGGDGGGGGESKQGMSEAMAADQVLDYVRRTHAPDEFNIEYSITDHPEWELKTIPLSQLNLDPDGEAQDPYNRVNWVDDDKVQELIPRIGSVLKSNPIVVDPEGWIIDGNHRAMAAVEAGLTSVPALVPVKQGVAEGSEQTPDQVRQTLNAWMNRDQQYEDPSKRAGFQAQVWPYIQQNIKTILADKGEKGNGDYPAAPYAAWLLVQHMDAYPQNQIEFYNALKQAIPNHPKIQFLRDRAAVNQWIMKNANNPEYFIKGEALPNPTVNVRNPDRFKDAGIVAASREEALANAEQAGNKLLVAAVQATNAQTQPSYKQSANENFADGKNPGRKGLAKRSGVNTKASVSSLRKTAKNSSGEKQRMAHWLANMKAGRAKAKKK